METKKLIVTINRELGSGGRTIGRLLAERLGVKYYDKALIEELTKKFDLSVEELEKVKASNFNWWNEFLQGFFDNYRVSCKIDGEVNIATTDNIFRIESQFIKSLAQDGSCVIAGRSGFYIFRNDPNAVKILIQSPMEKRVARVMEKQGLSENEAKKVIEKVDKGRERYTRDFSGSSRYDTRNYDLVLNVGGLSEEQAVDIIMNYIESNRKV